MIQMSATQLPKILSIGSSFFSPYVRADFDLFIVTFNSKVRMSLWLHSHSKKQPPKVWSKYENGSDSISPKAALVLWPYT